VTRTFKPQNVLSIPTQQFSTLEDALAAYFRPFPSVTTCECGEKGVPANRLNKFSVLPSVLVVQTTGGGLTLPLSLDLAPYALPVCLATSHSPLYSLVGMVHFLHGEGKQQWSMKDEKKISNHYHASAFNSADKTWYRFDDFKVSRYVASPSSDGAYLAFYVAPGVGDGVADKSALPDLPVASVYEGYDDPVDGFASHDDCYVMRLSSDSSDEGWDLPPPPLGIKGKQERGSNPADIRGTKRLIYSPLGLCGVGIWGCPAGVVTTTTTITTTATTTTTTTTITITTTNTTTTTNTISSTSTTTTTTTTTTMAVGPGGYLYVNLGHEAPGEVDYRQLARKLTAREPRGQAKYDRVAELGAYYLKAECAYMFRPGVFMASDAIDFYQEMLNQHFNSAGALFLGGKYCLYLGVHFHKKIFPDSSKVYNSDFAFRYARRQPIEFRRYDHSVHGPKNLSRVQGSSANKLVPAKMVMPVMWTGHFALLVVDFEQQAFSYYDSLYNCVSTACIVQLVESVKLFVRDVCNGRRECSDPDPLGFDRWGFYCPDDVSLPQQSGKSNDCLLFTCKYSFCVAKGATRGLTFPYPKRLDLLVQILSKKLNLTW
jgi:hypothetical protein